MADPAPKHRWNWNVEIGGISRMDILLFTRHLAVALRSGLTLQEGLDMLHDQSSSNHFKTMVGDLLERLRAGQPLHEALARYPRAFSAIYVSLVKTGELAGTLEENLTHLAEGLKKSEELRQKVRSALMYPLFVLVAIVGLGLSVALFILPKIVPLFKTLDVDLPVSTRGLLWVADLFSRHGVAMAVGLVAFFIFMVWFLRRKFIKPALHRFLLALPVLGNILKSIELERFSRTLGMLLRSAVPLDKSLRVTAEGTVNQVYKKAILLLVTEIEKGNGLSLAMANFPRLFPTITYRMVGMGERTGSLESTLLHLSDMYAEEVDNTMKNLSTILEPALLIFIGLIVGFVAISILGPIYKITGNLRQ